VVTARGICIGEAVVAAVVSQQFVVFGGTSTEAAETIPSFWPFIENSLPREIILKHVLTGGPGVGNGL